ncbi:hypothetical protein C2S52_003431 [Perilla frutescens var. hirtella]|nr:hypothetical protein C2S52_003431 [Perilla frutescens var. hirtella]
MIDFLNSAPEAPVVIILQFCRPNIYRGEVRISSLFNITKIVTDQNISEISEFCSSYLSSGKVRSTIISTLTSSSTRSLNDEIRDENFVLKTISEIMTDGEGPSFEGILAGIEQLANKKALFNVSVEPGQTRNYIGSFSVGRISTDRQIIQKVCGENVIEDETSASINGDEMIEEMIGSSSSKSVVELRSTEVISKTIQQILEDGQDEILDLLPAKIEGITTKKGLFNIIVLPEQVKNFNGPFDVVKVAHEDSIVGETSLNQEPPSKSKKGKEVIDDIADEDILRRDSLLTPKKMTSNTSNAVNIMDDEHVKRKLNDEFSATTQKRNKRLLKKDKMSA